MTVCDRDSVRRVARIGSSRNSPNAEIKPAWRPDWASEYASTTDAIDGENSCDRRPTRLVARAGPG
jgi:hypothetical protein